MPPELRNFTGDVIVNWHAQKYGHPVEEVRANFFKLKEFLFTCSRSDEEQIPTQEVDELWHSFILHTYSYTHFCEEYLGKYIHHYPKISSLTTNCSDTGQSLNASANCGDKGGKHDMKMAFAICGDKGINPDDGGSGSGGCVNPTR